MYFSIKFFSVSFVINEKKPTVMKCLFIYFGHHSLAFLNNSLNILNKYNILVLNKYNLEYVICLFINLFLQHFWGQGPTRWGTRAEDKGRGPRVEEHKHPPEITHLHAAQNMKFSINDFFSKCDHICRFGYNY